MIVQFIITTFLNILSFILSLALPSFFPGSQMSSYIVQFEEAIIFILEAISHVVNPYLFIAIFFVVISLEGVMLAFKLINYIWQQLPLT